MKFNLINPVTIGLGALLIGGVSSCKQEKAEEKNTHAYFDKAGMDSTVKPGDNFFLYANGGWMKTAVIPDDQSGWGSFYTLYQDNLQKLKGLLEDAAKSNSAKGTMEQKLGDYYASGMDTIAIEKIGAQPLKEGLSKIDAIKDYKELMNFVADMNAKGETYLLGLYVGADEKNSGQNIAVFYQTGTSLPEKDYYTRKDSASEASRKALVTYAEKMFTLAGTDAATAAKNASTVLALETEIAKTHRTPVEMRNPQANYNKMDFASLEKLSPNIDWKSFFEKMNVKVDSVNVSQPGYYSGLSKLLVSQPIDAWKTKLKFEYITSNASLLSKDFGNGEF